MSPRGPVIFAVLLASTAARAESREIERTPHPAILGVQLARQALPATGQLTAGAHVIYLNRTGAQLVPGDNDARSNRTPLIDHPVTIPAWTASDATWSATVDCLQEAFAPYDVELVENDPGNVDHVEAIFAGSPQQLDQPADVAGVSPFTRDCSVIENAIVFTFTDLLGDPKLVCETMAQEIAHAYGLDHAYHAPDVMSYLPFGGKRTFTDEEVECGELAPRPCGIAGSQCRERQRSAALLRARVGEPPFGRTSGGCAATRDASWLLVLAMLAISSRRARRG